MPGKKDLKNKTNTRSLAQLDKIDLIYGSDDPKKGYVFEQHEISEIKLVESIFSLLPRLKVKVMDDGLWYTTQTFRIGQILNLRITPVSTDESVKYDPYVNAMYKIENIVYNIDHTKNSYIYELDCLYDAEKYINDVVIYPPEDTKDEYTKNSKDVLSTVINSSGLKFSYDLGDSEPNDKMKWINNIMTYAEFAKHVISHAWINPLDMPILYTDKNGNCHYSSLNTETNKAEIHNLIWDTKYQSEIYRSEKYHMKPPRKIAYKDIMIVNGGIQNNNGAYNNVVYQYNPFDQGDINADYQEKQTINDSEVESFRKTEFRDNMLRIGKISNKASSSKLNTKNKINCGTYFPELHECYNIAPIHHENINKAFFQNFVYLTIDTSRQMTAYSTAEKFYPKLMQNIYLDASNKQYGSVIHSGKYMICALTHLWVPGRAYTIALQCVNDGVFDEGQLLLGEPGND